jgi:hypothetical protein
MGEHYRKGQTEAEAWCARCRRPTMHRVDHPPAGEKGGGRLGPCIDANHPPLGLSKKQLEQRAKEEQDRQNPRLF